MQHGICLAPSSLHVSPCPLRQAGMIDMQVWNKADLLAPADSPPTLPLSQAVSAGLGDQYQKANSCSTVVLTSATTRPGLPELLAEIDRKVRCTADSHLLILALSIPGSQCDAVKQHEARCPTVLARVQV